MARRSSSRHALRQVGAAACRELISTANKPRNSAPMSIRTSFVNKYLDPATSLGEILFGLIMTLTFTLGAGLTIQDEGRRRRTAAADRDDRLQHRLGRHRRCLLRAWPALRAGQAPSRCATGPRRHEGRRCGRPGRGRAGRRDRDGDDARGAADALRAHRGADPERRDPAESDHAQRRDGGYRELLAGVFRQPAGCDPVPVHRRRTTCLARIQRRAPGAAVHDRILVGALHYCPTRSHGTGIPAPSAQPWSR